MLIVIPTYNRLNLVKHSLTSVKRALDTSKGNHHLAIVDNHSTDGTAEWVKEQFKDYPKTVALSFSTNIGKAKAVNGAVKSFVSVNQSQELLCSFDSDLIISDNFDKFFDYFEEVYNYLKKNGYGFDVLCADQHGNSVHWADARIAHYVTEKCKVYFNDNGRGIAGSCLVTEISKFLSVGGYHENAGLIGGEDGFYIMDMRKKYKSRTGLVNDLCVYHQYDEDEGYIKYKQEAGKSLNEGGNGKTEPYWS